MQLLELSKKYGIAVITISLFLILSLTTEGFFTERNIRNLLDQQSTILIAASFMTIVIISGNFDISISAIFVVAPLFALNIENATGNILLSVLGGIGLGVILGSFNALVVTYFKVNSFIATLATSFMFFGFGYLISDRSLMRPVTDSYQQIARTKFFDITSATWISLVVVIVASILLTRTRFGRNVFATGGNQEAARLAGINVPQVQAITFILLGAAAALAGIVNSSRSISSIAFIYSWFSIYIDIPASRLEPIVFSCLAISRAPFTTPLIFLNKSHLFFNSLIISLVVLNFFKL